MQLPRHEADRAGTRKQAASGEAGDRDPEGVAPVERGIGALEHGVEEHDVGAQGRQLEAEENREPRKIGLASAEEDVPHVGHLRQDDHEQGRHENHQHGGGHDLAPAHRGPVGIAVVAAMGPRDVLPDRSQRRVDHDEEYREPGSRAQARPASPWGTSHPPALVMWSLPPTRSDRCP